MKRILVNLANLATKINAHAFSGRGVLFLLKQIESGFCVRDAEYTDDLEFSAMELLERAWTDEEKEKVFTLILPSPLTAEWTKFALDVFQNGFSEADESGRLAQIMGKEIAESKRFADWIWRNIQYTAGSMFHPVWKWEGTLPDVVEIAKLAERVAEKPAPKPAAPVKKAPAKKAEKKAPTANAPAENVSVDVPENFWEADVYSFARASAEMKPWNNGLLLRAGAPVPAEFVTAPYAKYIKAEREKYAELIKDGYTTADLWFPAVSHINSFLLGRFNSTTGYWKKADGSVLQVKFNGTKLEILKATPTVETPAVEAEAVEAEPKAEAVKTEAAEAKVVETEVKAPVKNGFIVDADVPEEFVLRYADVQATGHFATGGRGFILRAGSKSNPDERGDACPEFALMHHKADSAGKLDATGALNVDLLFATPDDAKGFILNGRSRKLCTWESAVNTGRSFMECATAYCMKYPGYGRIALSKAISGTKQPA